MTFTEICPWFVELVQKMFDPPPRENRTQGTQINIVCHSYEKHQFRAFLSDLS